LYRTPGPTIEEIVLVRRSRPRVRAVHAIGFTLGFASIASMMIVGAKDHWVALHVSMIVFAALALPVLFLRTQRLVVKRVGRELRIREGRREDGRHAHAVVVVLRDGRRVPVGDPRDLMFHAVADRKTIRDALLR
jgi:hypothetical protein